MIVGLMLLASVAGCVHRSPEARVLAAFRSSRFAANPVDSDRDTVARKCTATTAHVSSITGDTAIVSVFQDCVGPPCPAGMNCMGNVVRFETDYLVVRINGRWTVERPIAGGAGVLG